MKPYLFVLLLLPITAFAQIKITGKVLSAAADKPLGNVSVFLSNATVGSKTADDGTFTLYNVRPGQYEFVASAVGYSTYRIIVLAGNADVVMADIKLEAKTTELKEVAVTGANDWEKNFAKFRLDFLGSSPAASECKITNYDALTLEYDKENGKLIGSSNDFLEIENKYLGYKIKYLLMIFEKQDETERLHYAGSSVFEDLKGSPGEMRRWKNRRIEAYRGSSMHFFRSLIADEGKHDEFVVYRVIRKPNSNSKGGDDKFTQTLMRKAVDRPAFLHPTDRPDIFAINLEEPLYIQFRGSKLSSIISSKSKYAFFDRNGIVMNPDDVLFEGDWFYYRIPEMLPVDYVAEEKK